MTIEPYIIDTLMRDLVAHSRSPAAFLVYLQLYRCTHAAGKESIALSHQSLAEATGLSKRSVQIAIGHLIGRRLIQQSKRRPTTVPVYRVVMPWLRRRTPA